MSYKVKKSKIHGKGLFATEDFEPGEKIGNFEIEYVHDENEYTYYINYLKVNVTNDLKYANHSDDPNTVMVEFDMYAVRPIKKGEELCWHYGTEWV